MCAARPRVSLDSQAEALRVQLSVAGASCDASLIKQEMAMYAIKDHYDADQLQKDKDQRLQQAATHACRRSYACMLLQLLMHVGRATRACCYSYSCM